MSDTPSSIGAFDIAFAPIDGGASLDLDFEVEAAARGVSMEPIEGAIELFSKAVNASMFSMGRPASLVVEPKPAPFDGALAQRWVITGADVGSLRALTGLLDTLHFATTPLRRVRLEPHAQSHSKPHAASATPLLGRAELLALPYPRHPKPTPFELWLKHRLSGAKDYLIRLTFARAMSDAEFDQLEASFVLWNRLITHGAFGNERDEVQLDDSDSCSQTYMAAPDTLEHEFVRGIGQVGAFEALINMVIGIDQSLARVARFEIT